LRFVFILASVLFLASIAGGSGDITFCAEALSIILKCDDIQSLFLGVCKQAGGNVYHSYLQLRESLSSISSISSTKIKAIRLFERREINTQEDPLLIDVTFSIQQQQQQEEEDENSQFRINGIDQLLFTNAWTKNEPPFTVAIQCPLRVVSSGTYLCSQIGIKQDILRLITIREFGQSRFSQLTLHAHIQDVDVSAGLDKDELGLFSLSNMPLLSALSSSSISSSSSSYSKTFLSLIKSNQCKLHLSTGGIYVCGYFRTIRDSKPFGRAIALFLSLNNTITTLMVFLPMKRNREEDIKVEDISYVEYFIKGLLSTGLISNLVTKQDSLEMILTSIPHILITIHFEDSMSLGLPLSTFRSFLQNSHFNIVTGDMTLNEALCSKQAFYYSAEGHKIFVRESLYRQVFSHIETPSNTIVMTFWKYLEDKNVSSISSSSPSLSSSLSSSLPFPYTWSEITQSFFQVSTNILSTCGTLDNEILRLIL
jgi:hypothetical protein